MTLQLLVRKPPSAQCKAVPLLFIHGAWHGAWCWDEYWLPYFARQGYHCYALSLRGHGGSSSNKAMWRHGIDDYVADVETVCTQITQEHGCHPILIGHSMGGFITQKYLETHTVPAAVLLASIPHFGAWSFFLRTCCRHPLTLIKSIFSLQLVHFVNTPARTRPLFFSSGMPQADVERFTRMIGDEAWHMVLDVLLLKLPRRPKPGSPLLVMGAGNDNVIHKWEVRSLARAHSTEANIIPNIAHDMMIDTRWQAAADEVLGWLERI